MADHKVVNTKDLILEAAAAKAKAYAPYSDFAVGAALLTRSGQIFTGCNVENISFGLTICAERSAVTAAIASGEKDFTTIAVVTDLQEPVLPCGACLQVLAEFSPSMKIVAATTNGKSVEFDLSELLPKPVQGILGDHRDV